LKDVQNQQSPFLYEIPAVGIEELKAYVPINWQNKNYNLLCIFNIYVSLPANQKGIHMSRNSEAVYEAIESVIQLKHTSIEDLLLDLKEKLEEKHDYANQIIIELSTELPIEVETPESKKISQEIIPVKMILKYNKYGRQSKTLEVKVIGQTVCPCAQELTKETLNIDNLSPSHNQRGEMTIKFTCEVGYPITFEELYNIACKSMSAPTYSLLKRPDERSVVIQAHENPKFVEDCVRYAKYYLDELIEEKPKVWVKYKVKQINHESIHKHNAVALIEGEFQ
jgi:GTP cyclohydrolase-4